MKTLSIFAPAMVIASLLAGTSLAHAMSGGHVVSTPVVQVEQAIAAAKTRAIAAATKNAGDATKTK